MRVLILITLFLRGVFAFSQDYDRVLIPNMYVFDYRYVNSLYRNLKIDEASKVFNNINTDPYAYSFNNFMVNERESILKSNFSWVKKSGLDLAKDVLERKSINTVFPPSLTIKESESSYKAIVSREYIVEAFKNILKGNENNIHEINENYLVEVYGSTISEKAPLVVSIIKVQDSIFSSLNNNYMIGTLFKINDLSEIKHLKPELGYELSVVYGLIGNNFDLKISDFYVADRPVVALRKKPDLKSNEIITSLEEGDIVKLLVIGKYDVVNDQGGDWVKVLTEDNKSGWCLSSELFYHLDY